MATESEKSIFFNALDIESPRDRSAYVEQACRGNEHLFNAVCALLRENDRAENPVDRPLAPPFLPSLTMDQSSEVTDSRFAPGTMVGPYRLMEQIGEGGFGLVFVADQQKPVRRRVALKIIKPGMETREVIARFEAERQALAMMDHENIARVFDAGVTDDGQPYFVMELVRGVPLNEFSDNHRLDTRARLELFLSICNAVQHAHQKGIIHRDLKPSNVLVTLQDGRPIAKVIDFGIVKAIGQTLTDKTIYTRLSSMIGTPAYMSPEQAEMSNVDVDTRSDIYSLGVMLYELLTGSTPFTRDRLNSVGFDELRRIIREEEPPRPSARFSTLGDKIATTISANRRLEPAKLVSLMQGDLDWIVMKALDKDRGRRYPSANAMGEDVSRFLLGKPVEARPPSTLYRFTKFARRNKVVLATVSLVAAALIVGTVISVWQATIAYDALQQAQQAESAANDSRQELKEFTDRLQQANALLTSGRAFVEAGNLGAAHNAYTQATEVQPRYFHVWMERGLLYAKLGLWNRAAVDFSKAIELGCPVDRAEFMGVAQLFFFLRNEATYRLLSKSLADSNGGYLITKLGGLLVEPLEQGLAKQLASEAEQMLVDRRLNLPVARNRLSRAPRGAKLYLAGWAHLQAADLEQAIERLEQSNSEDPYWPGRGIGDPLLAIAYHQAGRDEEAIRALERSSESLSDWLDQSLTRQQGAPPIPWFDWVQFLISHQQASILVTGETPPTDPRLAEMEALAVAAIQ